MATRRKRLSRSFDKAIAIHPHISAPNFAIDWGNHDLYDSVINTRTLAVYTAAAIIILAVGANEFKKAFQPIEKLRDFALTQKAQAVLLEIPRLRIANLSVKQGIADLSGVAESLSIKEACEKAVMNIK